MELFVWGLVILLAFNFTEAEKDCQLEEALPLVRCCDKAYDVYFPYIQFVIQFVKEDLKCCGTKLLYGTTLYEDLDTDFPTVTKCCGALIYNVKTHMCCENKTYGFSSLQFVEELKCCGTKLLYGTTLYEDLNSDFPSTNTQCCGALTYNLEIHMCCNNTIYDLDEKACCGDQVYDLHPSICCYNKFKSVDGEEDCCTPTKRYHDILRKILNAGELFCCGNHTLEIGHQTEKCCNGVVYSIINQTCCGGYFNRFGTGGNLETHGLGSVEAYHKKIRCCGFAHYNVEKKVCCPHYRLVNHDAGEDYQKMRCCGNHIYNQEKKVCCRGHNSVTHDAGEDFRKLRCCGPNKIFVDIVQGCCNLGKGEFLVYNKTINGCCAKQLIDPSIDACCNDTKYNMETHGCCNNEVFDRERQGCCLKSKLYNDTTHGCCTTWGCEIGMNDFPLHINKVGFKVYNYWSPSPQYCCYNMRHLTRSGETRSDCLYDVFEQDTETCNSGTVEKKP